jgi:predicted metal-binding protein
MNSKVIQFAAAVFCLQTIIGCAVPGPRAAIINPQLIDQKEAKEKLISKYCDLVVKTNRIGFEWATAICRQIQTGDITLAGVKSSENGRYTVFMFKEKGEAALFQDNHAIIVFYFNPGSEVMRKCDQSGLCNVYVKNGQTRFGRSNIRVNGEPTVNDTGVTVKFNEDRSYAYDLLFSYATSNSKEGDELIAVFLSAFPFLFYQ